MFIFFLKLSLIVTLTVFITSLQGKTDLSFIGYEIHMHSTLFVLLIVLFIFVIWKFARVIDWLFYVPRNFFNKRKLEKKASLTDDIVASVLTKNINLLEITNKKIKSELGKNSNIYEFIDCKLQDKDNRIYILLKLIKNNELSASLKKLIIIEILKYDNEKINKELTMQLNSDNDSSALIDIHNCYKQESFDKAKAFLDLAKLKGITKNTYSFNLYLLKLNYNQEDAIEGVLDIWKKIKKDKYINFYMVELLESLKNVDKITAKQFKKIEKSITKKTWQGSLLITVIALKVPLYGVANDYFNNAVNLANDENNNLLAMVETELMLSRWDKITDQKKYDFVQKSIKYTSV
ncbi:MAG: heme biosynthesis HemY N-terminal domain-containing protein [Alphaproteobacteria bacterium]|nr:heme biosynthesis HemY N-terminal domain-containing protein [Alphaproteobacteria bacterium]